MDSKIKISIITPVWNGLPYLKQCINSVLEQNFQDWEMLISDDGSQDGSRDYLDTLTDVRIKVFKQEKNLGIFGNLNYIFTQVQSPICQFLFQDDYFIKNDSLSTIVNYWSTVSPEVGFARFNHSGPSPCLTIAFEKQITPEILTSKRADLWFFVFGCVASNMSNVTLRTNIIEDLGWFRQDMPYAGDYEFWIRAARKYSMGFQKTRVTFVRSHSKQASVHLNRQGELITQIEQIVSNLYVQLIKQHPNLEMLFKLQASLNYDSLFRDVAIRFWLKGNKSHLNELNRINQKANYIYPKPTLWAMYWFTLGGRIFRDMLAKFLIKKALKTL